MSGDVCLDRQDATTLLLALRYLADGEYNTDKLAMAASLVRAVEREMPRDVVERAYYELGLHNAPMLVEAWFQHTGRSSRPNEEH